MYGYGNAVLSSDIRAEIAMELNCLIAPRTGLRRIISHVIALIMEEKK